YISNLNSTLDEFNIFGGNAYIKLHEDTINSNEKSIRGEIIIKCDGLGNSSKVDFYFMSKSYLMISYSIRETSVKNKIILLNNIYDLCTDVNAVALDVMTR
ncbi:MAG: hypothetical protein ABF567_05240, partial [Acetobacter okinawensis]